MFLINRRNTEISITDFLRLWGRDDAFKSRIGKLRPLSKIIHHITWYSFPCGYVVSGFFVCLFVLLEQCTVILLVSTFSDHKC